MAFSTQRLMSPAPPLGIRRSTSPTAFMISSADLWSVSSMNPTSSSGSSASASPCFMAFTMASLDLKASLPPLKITAFPDFSARTAASEVTLGLLSYIMATTPKGTEVFSITMPLGLSILFSTLPSGSGRAATSSTPLAMSPILFSVRVSLSIMTSPRWSLAASTSSALAFRISSFSAISLFAMASRAAFFFSFEAASAGRAFFVSKSISRVVLISAVSF